MPSFVSTLHEMVGVLREDLDCLIAPKGTPLAGEAAKTHLAEIAALAQASPSVARAARHVSEAIDRVLKVKEQAQQAGSPLGAEQTSRAVNLVEDPVVELTRAVNGLP